MELFSIRIRRTFQLVSTAQTQAEVIAPVTEAIKTTPLRRLPMKQRSGV